jgi:hypothetical protein
LKNKCFIQKNWADDQKEDIRREVCQDLLAEYEKNGNFYCILHYPDNKKPDIFEKELEKRFTKQDYNFRSVYFPRILDISGKDFEKTVDFGSAIFKQNVNFIFSNFTGGALFYSAIFHKHVNFMGANFKQQALFFGAVFINSADFDMAVFRKGVNFNSAIFNEKSNIRFLTTSFENKVSFRWATIKGYVQFEGGAVFDPIDGKKRLTNVFDGNKASLDLHAARIEKPEQIIFHSTRLQPNWFINQESTKKIIFTNCIWRTYDGNRLIALSEIKEVKNRGGQIQNPYKLLSEACWQLADNYEERKGFKEASLFRLLAFEAEWIERKEKFCNWVENLDKEAEKQKRRFGGSTNEEDKPNPPTNSFGILRRSDDFIIHGLYRFTSYYGESWSWAAFVLLLFVFAIFPLIYTQTNFQNCPREKPISISLSEENCKTSGLDFDEAVAHSLITATFQNVDYRKPTTIGGEIWVILEKIFAPLQAALLVLAIRRKFMR